MESPAFLDLVRRHFGFLIDDHGFVVAESLWWPGHTTCGIVFQSQDYRVEVARDRGDIFLDVGPASLPRVEFPIENILAFLIRENKVPADHEGESLAAHAGTEEQQVEQLADLLKRHSMAIFWLFKEDVFREKQGELTDFARSRSLAALEKALEERRGMRPEDIRH